MKNIDKALKDIEKEMGDRDKRSPVPLNEYLKDIADNPDIAHKRLRSIFQRFYDFFHDNIEAKEDEYPDDPESINYVEYDTRKLLVSGCDRPFFADRLFANRLVKAFAFLKRGEQNKIFNIEGPPGCGKSRCITNLLLQFEEYANSDNNMSDELIWILDKPKIKRCLGHIHTQPAKPSKEKPASCGADNQLVIPCPGHDHPLLVIPKRQRSKFLHDLIQDDDFKTKLFGGKEYEWMFNDSLCPICTAVFRALLDRLGSIQEVFSMVYVRKYIYDRKLGEGITVFSPGDGIPRDSNQCNEKLEEELRELFPDSNIRYRYSMHAQTNNGIYALMDIKQNNAKRLGDLHNIISEGVCKVENTEESVRSLFIAISNPGDFDSGNKDSGRNILQDKSFQDRISKVKMPYVLDYRTEVEIYRDSFGRQIDGYFLPRVLNNFAKVIISSRLQETSEALYEWLGDAKKYHKYCDPNLHLLKMHIYTGHIPDWITEEDRKSFKKPIRRKLIDEGEQDGGGSGHEGGFTGRESINIFDTFLAAHAREEKLITMKMVFKFFLNTYKERLPGGFLDALVRLYNYSILQEVKESLYYYSAEQITRDIIHYLHAINFDLGQTTVCTYTGEEITVTKDFFDKVEPRIFGVDAVNLHHRLKLREAAQKEYTSKTLSREIHNEGRNIADTEQYQYLYGKYTYNLKERVLDPLVENENFRNAIKDFKDEKFKTYDREIQKDVTFLIKNLQEKFKYTEQGAQEICIYVIDNGVAQAFSRKK